MDLSRRPIWKRKMPRPKRSARPSTLPALPCRLGEIGSSSILQVASFLFLMNPPSVSASASPTDPYLSVVVTTRNDDHGGDPLKRLQAFVNYVCGSVPTFPSRRRDRSSSSGILPRIGRGFADCFDVPPARALRRPFRRGPSRHPRRR